MIVWGVPFGVASGASTLGKRYGTTCDLDKGQEVAAGEKEKTSAGVGSRQHLYIYVLYIFYIFRPLLTYVCERRHSLCGVCVSVWRE